MRAVHRQAFGNGFRYIEFLPQIARARETVLIYLHGIGERGSDPNLVKCFGLPAMIDRRSVSTNCSVICPQLEREDHWPPQQVASFIEDLKQRVENVALVGYSLGASGVCSLISQYGKLVTLAVAIAGQAPNRAEVSQVGVSLLAIQGEVDPWPSTAAFVESVNAMGGVARSVVLRGQGHYISEEAILHPVCLSMLQSVGIEVHQYSNAG